MRCDGEKRLHRDVELAAEAAAAGGRADADFFVLDAEHASGFRAIHVRRLRAGGDLHPIAVLDRVAGLRLDVGVLDERRLEAAFDSGCGVRVAGDDVAAFQIAADQDVVRSVRMERVGSWCESRVDAGERVELRPRDRKVGVGYAFDRGARADQRQHRLAAEAHFSGREHRLVAEMRKDAEGIFAGHIVGGEDRHEAGRARDDRIEIAEGEGGAGVRRANNAHPERVGGGGIGAEEVRASDFREAVDARETRADESAALEPLLPEGEGVAKGDG